MALKGSAVRVRYAPDFIKQRIRPPDTLFFTPRQDGTATSGDETPRYLSAAHTLYGAVQQEKCRAVSGKLASEHFLPAKASLDLVKLIYLPARQPMDGFCSIAR